MYNRNLRSLAAIAETTPGTAMTSPTSPFRIREPEWTPNIEMEGDKYATGDLAENEDIPGNQIAETKFKIKLAKGSAVNVDPDWSLFAESSGWKKTAYTTVGIAWRLHTDNFNKTMTQWGLEREVGATPKQRAQKFKGMIGNMKIMTEKRGKPVHLDFNFKGAFAAADADIANGSIIALGSVDTTVSEKFLGSTCSIFGTTERAEKFDFDSGCTISESGDQSDSTGVQYCYIEKIAPRLKMTLEMASVATVDPTARWAAGTIGVVIITISSNVKLTIPRAQVIDCKPVDVNGKMHWDITFKCLRNGSVDGTMDTQSVAELLIGTKT